jgi:hypothetical protein
LSEVEDSEPKLYGTSPRVIALLMTIVTFIVPFGYLPPGSRVFFGFFFITSDIGSGIYGLLWFIGFANDLGCGYFGFHVLKVGLMGLTVVLSIFNLLFARQIVRYYQGKSSQQRVLLIGAVSLIYPALLGLMPVPIPLAMFGFVWPIPIQFIFGLILLRKIPGPDLIHPPIE